MSTITLSANYLFDIPREDKEKASIFSEQTIEPERLSKYETSERDSVHIAFDSNIEFLKSNQATANYEVERAQKDQILSSVLNRISAIKAMADNWNDEGLKGPNSYSIDLSIDLAHQFVENDFLPTVVTQTVEEGICFIFKSSSQFLYLEIYNDCEMGFITEDYKDRKILSNKSVKTKNDIIRELSHFFYK